MTDAHDSWTPGKPSAVIASRGGGTAASRGLTLEEQSARDMVHDLKNLLTPILGYVQLVLHDMPADDAQYRRIKKIQRAALSAQDVVLHTLAGASGAAPAKPMNLNGWIRAWVETVEGMIPENVRLELNLAPDAGTVGVKTRDMRRVLTNLIANACQAMPQGGMLQIQTARCNDSSADVVRITVRDTGCGIAPETMGRIFEPGYTTRSGGNGLGMACVRRIARTAGGWVKVDSVPGAGTAVHVLLPKRPSTATTSKVG
jgi:signal transduction histidine kinase